MNMMTALFWGMASCIVGRYAEDDDSKFRRNGVNCLQN